MPKAARSCAGSQSSRSWPWKRIVAALRRIEPRHQLDQRRLPGTVHADDGDALAAADIEIDVAQRREPRARIGEADVGEFQAGVGVGARHGRAGPLRGLLLQVFVQVGEVQVVLVHAPDRRQHGTDRCLPLLEDQQVHGHVAQRDGPLDGGDHDPGVGAVERRVAEYAQREAPTVAADGQRAVFLVEVPEDAPVAVQAVPGPGRTA